MKYSIKLFLSKGNLDWNKIIYSEDRYIIIDANGFDVCGEHYEINEAKEVIKHLG
jgi:hypothetical protein